MLRDAALDESQTRVDALSPARLLSMRAGRVLSMRAGEREVRQAPAHFARIAARLRTMTAVATSTTATPRPTSDQAASDGNSTARWARRALTPLAVSVPPP